MQQKLNRETDFIYLKRGTPFILQNVEANSAQPVNVGVVDFGQEANFRGDHGIILWQVKLQLKNATFVRRTCGPGDYNVKVSKILFVGRCTDACDDWRMQMITRKQQSWQNSNTTSQYSHSYHHNAHRRPKDDRPRVPTRNWISHQAFRFANDAARQLRRI